MANQNSNLAAELISVFEGLRSDRSTFNTLCKEVADRVMPDAAKEFDGPAASATEGEDNNTYLNIDSTASNALNRYASIIDSSVTPRNSIWSKLTTSNPLLANEREVKVFFEDVNTILFKYRYSPRANFAPQNHKVFKTNGAFGNGIMYIDKLDTEPGVRYKSCGLGTIYFTRNHQGIVNGIYRHFKLKAIQAYKKWGELLPDKIKDKARGTAEAQNTDFEFLHAVRENDDVNPLRIDFKGMAFASYYVSFEGKALIERGGYRSFPYSISGAISVGDELYDRGPAMEVIAAIRTLNEQKRTVLKQGHRAVDPVMLTYDDGIASRFSLRPGALNSGGMTKDGRPLVGTLPVGNIAIGKDLMDDERSDIKDAFLVTLYQILTDSPQKTATEVIEDIREKGILLSPAFSKQEIYLGNLIERELEVLAFQGLVPELPPVLREAAGEYTIVYDSPFSRIQKAEDAAGFVRLMGWATEWANNTQDPSVYDVFNLDVAIPELAEINGVPFKWLRSPKDIDRIRAQRQQAAEQHSEVEQAPATAAMINALSKAKKDAPEEYDAAAQALAG